MANDTAKAVDKYWVGFDLGGTKMLAQVFDKDYKILGSKKRKTRGQEGQEAGLERLVNTIKDALEDAGLQANDIGSIGVGCPGPLDLEAGILLNTPNLGWKNARLKKLLEDTFGCPSHIANDVDAGIYGEYTAGAARGSRCALGIFPGTGIGGGCVYDGQLLRGRKNSCMEIGHMHLQPRGRVSGLGHHGTLEAIASRLAIASEAALAAMRGQAPYLLANYGTDPMNIRSGALMASIQNGDTAVETIVRDAAYWIGLALGNTINLLSPDVVVVGGGLAEAMPDLFLKEICEACSEAVMPSFRKTYEVRIAELGDNAGTIGAAAWARYLTAS